MCRPEEGEDRSTDTDGAATDRAGSTGGASSSAWTWPAGIGLAVGTLSYLVPGTVVAVLLFLLTPPVRAAVGRG